MFEKFRKRRIGNHLDAVISEEVYGKYTFRMLPGSDYVQEHLGLRAREIVEIEVLNGKIDRNDIKAISTRYMDLHLELLEILSAGSWYKAGWKENLSNTDKLVNEIYHGVNSRITSKKVALQFVLEELDAAREGNDAAVQFVENSGFDASEYEGAMENSFEEVDGDNGPQQFLLSSILPYVSDGDFMVNLRLRVVKRIINEWGLTTQNGDMNDKFEFIDRSGNKVRYSGEKFALSPTLYERYTSNPRDPYDAQQFTDDLKFLNQEQLFLLNHEIIEALERAKIGLAGLLRSIETQGPIEPSEMASHEKWIDVLQCSSDIITDKTKNLGSKKIISVNEKIKGGGNTPVPQGVDEVEAAKLFSWSDDEDIIFRSLRYNEIRINEGLTAVSSDNMLVPVSIVLYAEEASLESELFKAFREHYIKVCNENDLSPNTNLCIAGVRTGAKTIVVEIASGRS